MRELGLSGGRCNELGLSGGRSNALLQSTRGFMYCYSAMALFISVRVLTHMPCPTHVCAVSSACCWVVLLGGAAAVM